MKERVLYLLKFYVVTVFIFVIAKIVFILYNISRDDLSIYDVIQVFRHGMSLDLSTTLYLLAIPFLLVTASLWLRIPKWPFRVFYGIVAFLLSLAFIADTSLYEFWRFKLDASCLSYLETPTEAMASVTVWYILVRLFWLIVCSAAIYWVYDKLTPVFAATTHRIVGTIVALLLIPLIVIGIRGGVDESTTNIGQVYYSQNQFWNHSAVNPVFSFFASFEKTASNSVSYHFMDDNQCQQIIRQLYHTDSVNSDTLLNTQKPNVIVILLESCGGVFTELGGRSDITPNLNRYAAEGVCFTNCYANSWRTDRGTVCIWSGYPSFPTMSVMKMPSKSRSLPNIARSLQDQRGYTTHYLYGGDINFTNMRSYLIAGGFKELTWKEDYTKSEQKTSQWGVRDDITFETLLKLSTSLPQPFLIGYSTLSSHAPWDVPIRHFDDEMLNAFYYLDQCVGQFIEKLRKSDAWKNTLVVMLPDHSVSYNDMDESDPMLNRIPVIWVGGAVKKPCRIDKICNQTDLPATLLAQLGLSHKEYSFSRDVLSQSYTYPFAIHTYDDGFTMIDSAGFVNYDFVSDRIVFAKGIQTDKLVQQSKAILQAASKDLNER